MGYVSLSFESQHQGFGIITYFYFCCSVMTLVLAFTVFALLCDVQQMVETGFFV